MYTDIKPIHYDIHFRDQGLKRAVESFKHGNIMNKYKFLFLTMEYADEKP